MKLRHNRCALKCLFFIFLWYFIKLFYTFHHNILFKFIPQCFSKKVSLIVYGRFTNQSWWFNLFFMIFNAFSCIAGILNNVNKVVKRCSLNHELETTNGSRSSIVSKWMGFHERDRLFLSTNKTNTVNADKGHESVSPPWGRFSAPVGSSSNNRILFPSTVW